MIEFTGERVVPGQVDVDLWNEHVARYAFASRFAAGRRVLDAGSGSGYGSAELAAAARSVVGLDVSEDAVRYARESYGRPNLSFLRASCAALPLATASVDLAVSFEVIEHIAGWESFLKELRRVLVPGGVAVISTPNKDYYADSRRQTGPNPYHVHEFSFEEFAAALGALFPCVSLYLENHVEGIAFQPASSWSGTPELRHAGGAGDPAAAHFYVAVCSDVPQPPAHPFLYVPSAANVLRERELHIDKLEADVARLREEKQNLVEMFRLQKEELERSNAWAAETEEKLAAAQARIVQLQDEAAEMRAGYEAKIAGLESENNDKTVWALRLDGELTSMRESRWVKIGNRLGVGPESRR